MPLDLTLVSVVHRKSRGPEKQRVTRPWGGVAVVLVCVMFLCRPRITGRLVSRHRFNLIRAATIFCVASSVICFASSARAQSTEAGPYTITSVVPSELGGLINTNTLTSGMPAQGNPVYGAINTVLQSPTSPNTYRAGTVGGGIWMTTDGGQTWKPTNDKQLSLAIGSLALDSADSSGQTIYAGTGQYSNYAYPFVPVPAPSAAGIPACSNRPMAVQVGVKSRAQVSQIINS